MFVCDCGNKYSSVGGLNLHKSRFCVVNKNIPKYSCDCGAKFFKFRGEGSLREHRKACEIFKEAKTKRHSSAAKATYKKLKESGRLDEIRERSSKKISETIMNNPKERARRAKLLAGLNKTDEFRNKASETAIKTSARPEIQKQRADRLKNWRDNNFEEFYEKCVLSAIAAPIRQTKPEKELSRLLKKIQGFDFKYSQIVKSKKFNTKSNKKQVDFADKHKHIYIEFDGIFHFKNISNFKEIKRKDRVLNEIAIERNYCMIRISYDQFSDRKGDCGFKQDCISKLKEILDNPKPGLYFIGEAYNDEN